MQHLRGELRAIEAQPIHIHAEEREVLPECEQPDAAVLEDVALPDLDESSVAAQNADAEWNRVASQRVEDDVHAVSAGLRKHLVCPCQRARVHHVLDADRRQVGALLRAARGREYFRADFARDLNRG